jgi:hypothetical protein
LCLIEESEIKQSMYFSQRSLAKWIPAYAGMTGFTGMTGRGGIKMNNRKQETEPQHGAIKIKMPPQ